MKTKTMTKEEALADHLGTDLEEARDILSEPYPDYLVLTDEEADEQVKEDIRESVWAFNASFIIENTDLTYEAEEMITGFQQAKCEGANDTILSMINDFDAFVESAIGANGRGHFLSSYDGNECEIGQYLIYRIN